MKLYLSYILHSIVPMLILARYKKITKRNHPLHQSIVNKGNGYKTRQASKGLTKEQTLMLSRTSTLHNLLFYAHSLCLIDQTQTFLLAHCSICAGMCLFCSGSPLKKVNKKIKQWFHNHSTLLTMTSQRHKFFWQPCTMIKSRRTHLWGVMSIPL